VKRRIGIAALSLAVTALFFGACSNGGEGDRCSLLADNSGNDDCQNGLKCTAAGELSGNQQTDRCCPQDRSTSAAGSVCALAIPSNGLGADSAIPAEAAVADGPVVLDSAPDTSDAGDSG
jgi:hypothetical protein